MSGNTDSQYIRVEITESDDIDELVLAYRQDDQLRELTGLSPPVEAVLKKIDA